MARLIANRQIDCKENSVSTLRMHSSTAFVNVRSLSGVDAFMARCCLDRIRFILFTELGLKASNIACNSFLDRQG